MAKVHKVDYEGKGGPLVGALLRKPFMTARAHIVEVLHDAGFDDLQAAHLVVFQYPGPQGRSPGDIARTAGMSKQAMNNLLAQLERSGLLLRAVNPENRRERVIELTHRGEEVIAVIRGAVTSLEKTWSGALGDGEYRQLRGLLERLNEVVS